MNISSSFSSSNLTHHIYHHPHHSKRVCQICKNRYLPSTVRHIGPYLIHHRNPNLSPTCPCGYSCHLVCLKKYGTDFVCRYCNFIYHVKRHMFIAQALCLLCHLFSLASAIGLVFGLCQLGRALDELGLGSEVGPKLDGDEKWHDHELEDIVEWLNTVHLWTGVAGEALLGLVYLIGVCLVIGLDRTLLMISGIFYIQLDRLKNTRAGKSMICISLFLLGLCLGTYLLFFSWIWASVLNHIKIRLLDSNWHKASFEEN